MIRVDLLSIPPFSKKVKGWTIRQIPPPGQELTRLAYPNRDHATTSTSGALQPCKIEYKVPAHVLVRKNPTISWWDPQTQQWGDHVGIRDSEDLVLLPAFGCIFHHTGTAP